MKCALLRDTNRQVAGPLMSMKAKEMRTIAEDAGLHLESTHYGMDELTNSLDERIVFALDSGQKQMIVSSFGLPEQANMSDWMKKLQTS